MIVYVKFAQSIASQASLHSGLYTNIMTSYPQWESGYLLYTIYTLTRHVISGSHPAYRGLCDINSCWIDNINICEVLPYDKDSHDHAASVTASCHLLTEG